MYVCMGMYVMDNTHSMANNSFYVCKFAASSVVQTVPVAQHHHQLLQDGVPKRVCVPTAPSLIPCVTLSARARPQARYTYAVRPRPPGSSCEGRRLPTGVHLPRPTGRSLRSQRRTEAPLHPRPGSRSVKQCPLTLQRTATRTLIPCHQTSQDAGTDRPQEY